MRRRIPFVAPGTIRTAFTNLLSVMYKQEVPQYGTLVELVQAVNRRVLSENPALARQLQREGELVRLDVERHGAIRLAKDDELKTVGRIFGVMGMLPVNYYNLADAGLPVHSTAFRPVDESALKENPFRVFTSLLRLDLLPATVREEVKQIVQNRDVFTPRLRELLEVHDSQGGFTEAQAENFVSEALETFRWNEEVAITHDQYERLHKVHRLVADVVLSDRLHLNHLTPRTLDIDAVQRAMPQYGLSPKAVVEGSSDRVHDILLRQTSIKALRERVMFRGVDGVREAGDHTARFGEVEERGAALTAKGMKLYTDLMGRVRARVSPALDGSNADEYMDVLREEFQAFPDDEEAMRAQGLIFVRYYATEKGKRQKGNISSSDLDALIRDGLIGYTDITYEDFEALNAGGIFTSNLGDDSTHVVNSGSSQHAFEAVLGRKVLDSIDMYAATEASSLLGAFVELGIGQRLSCTNRLDLQRTVSNDPRTQDLPILRSVGAG